MIGRIQELRHFLTEIAQMTVIVRLSKMDKAVNKRRWQILGKKNP